MSSAGVSELMDAEKKASTVVAEARAARSAARRTIVFLLTIVFQQLL